MPIRRAAVSVLSSFLLLSAIGVAEAQTPDSARANADPAPSPEPEGRTRSTLDGVFSEAQAQRGEQLMMDICAECHAPEDYTGPFLADWEGASVWRLFDELQNTMPEDNPGGLRREEYVEAIAYIFRLNGLPAGEADLPADRPSLEKVLIRRP